MNEKDLEKLYNMLIEFAESNCYVSINYCRNNCPIGVYCSMLDIISKGLSRNITLDEAIEGIDIDYKNIKWEEGSEDNE